MSNSQHCMILPVARGIGWQFEVEKTVKDTVFFSLSLKTRELLLNHTAESSSALLWNEPLEMIR